MKRYWIASWLSSLWFVFVKIDLFTFSLFLLAGFCQTYLLITIEDQRKELKWLKQNVTS